MKERPKCAMEGCEKNAWVLVHAEGFEDPVFVCFDCLNNNPKVKGRVKVI